MAPLPALGQQLDQTHAAHYLDGNQPRDSYSSGAGIDKLTFKKAQTNPGWDNRQP